MDLSELAENIVPNTREYREGKSLTVQIAPDADVSKIEKGGNFDLEFLAIKLRGWDLTDKGKKISSDKETLAQIQTTMPELFTFVLDMAVEVVNAPLGKLTSLKN